MSINILIEKIIEKQNPSVAGLDPRLEYIPEFIKDEAKAKLGNNLEAAASAIFEYNKGLIDALCDIVPAVKPQSAYYELYGWQGVKCLHDTIAYAKQKGLYVIADVKRNDIGSTADAYADAYLGKTDVFGTETELFGADAATINAYLGSDGVIPFMSRCKKYNKMVFILVKTSNLGSAELQNLSVLGRETVFETVADKVIEWGQDNIGKYGYSEAGAVVGATYPKELSDLRMRMENTFFLVPGYGAQGAGAAEIKGAFDSRGLGGIVNSSRAILCAWQKQKCEEKDYAKAARTEAIRMKDEIMNVIGKQIGEAK